MTKFDLWTTIIRALAKASLMIWDQEIIGSWTFPATSNVEIRYISSVNPPRLRTKFIVWTLAESFDLYNEQRHYSDSFLKITLGSGPSPPTLGVASIKTTLLTVGSQSNSSIVSLLNGTSFEPESSKPAWSRVQSRSTPLTSDSNMDLFQSDSDSQSPDSLHVKAGSISFLLTYKTSGQVISDGGFYDTMISTIIFAAQHDPKNRACGVMRSYNPHENYTFVMGPTSDAARDNLSWKLAIQALAFLPTEMLAQRPGGYWAELSGRIKLDGAYVGKIELMKGDHRDVGCA